MCQVRHPSLSTLQPPELPVPAQEPSADPSTWWVRTSPRSQGILPPPNQLISWVPGCLQHPRERCAWSKFPGNTAGTGKGGTASSVGAWHAPPRLPPSAQLCSAPTQRVFSCQDSCPAEPSRDRGRAGGDPQGWGHGRSERAAGAGPRRSGDPQINAAKAPATKHSH